MKGAETIQPYKQLRGYFPYYVVKTLLLSYFVRGARLLDQHLLLTIKYGISEFFNFLLLSKNSWNAYSNLVRGLDDWTTKLKQ